MGLYDGASGRGELASTAHVAKLLQAPVVLVVDAAAMARSVAAIVHGYRTFDPDVNVAGVILNRVGSEAHAQILRDALPDDIAVLGALPRDPVARGPRAPPRARARRRARAAGARRDRGARRRGRGALRPRRARRARQDRARPARRGVGARHRPSATTRIAIARGPAFSFHYEENLELLRGAGAELLAFDPLTDEPLPDADALILAGGFPEVFGAELSANAALRAQIAAFSGPILAECGGLLYLANELDGHPMCGVIDAAATMTGRLKLGYREVQATADHPVWPAGTTVRGHEFHYSTVSPAGEAWTAHRRPRPRRRPRLLPAHALGGDARGGASDWWRHAADRGRRRPGRSGAHHAEGDQRAAGGREGLRARRRARGGDRVRLRVGAAADVRHDRRGQPRGALGARRARDRRGRTAPPSSPRSATRTSTRPSPTSPTRCAHWCRT